MNNKVLNYPRNEKIMIILYNNQQCLSNYNLCDSIFMTFTAHIKLFELYFRCQFGREFGLRKQALCLQLARRKGIKLYIELIWLFSQRSVYSIYRKTVEFATVCEIHHYRANLLKVNKTRAFRECRPLPRSA